ncbi:MAG: extracellular solute-binding protein [Christensenellales bacterium]|jgi:putative aldouronate transport system substrate-binding protein
MKKFSRVLSFLMAVAMLVSYAAFAEELGVIRRHQKGADLSKLPIVEETVTVDVWRSFSSTIMESLSQCEVFKKMEELTNVHINWVYPPVGSATDNFNLRCASNDLPHMFSMPPEYAGGVENGVADGVYMAFTSYYDDGFAPNLKYLRDTDAKIAKDSVMDSGELIKWHMLDYVPSSPWSGLWVRQDLLEKAGLEAPVTVDDWTNMLRTFKEQFGTILGLNIPNWYGVGTNYAFAATYDTGYSWFAIDGKTAAFGPAQPGYKDFLTLLNGWYVEGLYDPDFATLSNSDYQAKMADGTYGAFGSAYGEIGQAKVSGMNANPEYKLLAVKMPVQYEGQLTHLRQFDSIVRTDYDVLTARCEDEGIAETVVAWKDFWYSQTGGDLCSYGPEGVSYKWEDDDTLTWIYEETGIVSKGDDMDFWTVYPLFKLHNWGYLRDSTAYEMQPEVWQCIEAWGSDGADWFMPMIAESAEETEEINRIMTNINTYREEMTFKFITGQESLDNFDAFVQNMYDMGLEDAVALKQDALDRYLER